MDVDMPWAFGALGKGKGMHRLQVKDSYVELVSPDSVG